MPNPDPKAARRAALLAAARDVFVTRGYHDAKVDDIVAAANVAKGTFYLYFEDKRSVFAELVDQVVEQLTGAIVHVDVGADIEAQIRANIRGVVRVMRRDPLLTRILLSYAPGLDPAFEKHLRGFYDGLKRLLEESLAEGQGLGIVAPGDARLYASFTIGGLKEVLLDTTTTDGDGATVDLPRLEDAVFRLLEGLFLRVDPRPQAETLIIVPLPVMAD